MNCKNCQTQLSEESEYCYSCGGKVIRNRLTMRNLFEHFTQTYLNYDNRFFQTFLYLFKKPEDVIESYINGTRKKYADVISYFALALTFAGLYVFIQRKFFPEYIDYSFLAAKGQEEMQKDWILFVMDYMSIFTMLYVPFYALMARITFLGLNKFNYTELLVIFMYVQAQLSIISAILTITIMLIGWNMAIATLIVTPIMILYSGYCLKRLYELNIAQMLLRSLIFIALLFVGFILAGFVMVIVWYFTGELQTMIEAQNAAKDT